MSLIEYSTNDKDTYNEIKFICSKSADEVAELFIAMVREARKTSDKYCELKEENSGQNDQIKQLKKELSECKKRSRILLAESIRDDD